MLRILNLGAGVQSSAVLLMSVQGDLPKLDHAIFADTGDEPLEVYQWLDFLTPICAEAGIALHVVRSPKGTMSEYVVKQHQSGKRVECPPLFTQGDDGRATPINRSCTREWKIDPIRRATKKILGLNPRDRWPKQLAVETWLGISGDEKMRMKVSTEPWQRFWHPLIEDEWEPGGKWAQMRMPSIHRAGCLEWMHRNGYPPPPRSACWHCRFRSNEEWRHLRDTDPEAFEQACDYDDNIRGGKLFHGMRKPVYVHRSLVPLREADLGNEAPGLFDDECFGICGV